MKKFVIVIGLATGLLFGHLDKADARVTGTSAYCMNNGVTVHNINFKNHGTTKARYWIHVVSGENFSFKHMQVLRPGGTVTFLVPTEGVTRVTLTKYHRVVYSRIFMDLCL